MNFYQDDDELPSRADMLADVWGAICDGLVALVCILAAMEVVNLGGSSPAPKTAERTITVGDVFRANGEAVSLTINSIPPRSEISNPAGFEIYNNTDRDIIVQIFDARDQVPVNLGSGAKQPPWGPDGACMSPPCHVDPSIASMQDVRCSAPTSPVKYCTTTTSGTSYWMTTGGSGVSAGTPVSPYPPPQQEIGH